MNLERIKERIKGPAFPVITPFKSNGDIDFNKTVEYIDFLYDNGANIIYTMAHSSRLGLMSVGEIKELNTVVCEATKKYPDTVAIAATPMYRSTKTTADVAMCASDSGADLVSVIFCERLYTYQQVIEFFSDVSYAVDCGILVHEEQLNTIHGTQRINWPLDLLEAVVRIPNVIAIKEDAKDDGFTEELVKKFHEDAAIIVSGGSKKQFMQFAPLGCQSYLVGLGSFDPSIAVVFYKAYLNGELDWCNKLINNVETPFFDVSKEMGWHIGIKSAMEHMGIMSRVDRRPLKEADEFQHDQIRIILEKLGYL
jgi:4-hydroxy-tetrahydrodipicolinate synthase